jgi:quinol monooxygenase YgiN
MFKAARMNQDQSKVLISRVTALPGFTDEVRAQICEYGETVRQEPGNQVFACHQVADRPEKFIVFEVYDDEVAFQTHLAAPENAEINARPASLIAGNKSTLTFLKLLE